MRSLTVGDVEASHSGMLDRTLCSPCPWLRVTGTLNSPSHLHSEDFLLKVGNPYYEGKAELPQIQFRYTRELVR